MLICYQFKELQVFEVRLVLFWELQALLLTAIETITSYPLIQMLTILRGSSFFQLFQQPMPQFRQDVVVFLLSKKLTEQMALVVDQFIFLWVQVLVLD